MNQPEEQSSLRNISSGPGTKNVGRSASDLFERFIFAFDHPSAADVERLRIILCVHAGPRLGASEGDIGG